MKKLLLLIATVMLTVGLSGCLYTKIAAPQPLEIDNSVKAEKSGKACQTFILGLIFTGDASVAAAEKAGGITKVHNVDYTYNHILGYLYGTECTVVYGE